MSLLAAGAPCGTPCGAQQPAAAWQPGHLAARPWGRRRRRCRAWAGGVSGGDAAEAKARLLQAISRCNNPRPGDNLLQLEQRVEDAAEALAALNPTPDPALDPLLLGCAVLLFSGRSRRLAASANFPEFAGAGASLQQALQAASDRLYSLLYDALPVLAGSAVGARRGAAATNTQVLAPGRVDNIVETTRGLPLRLCVSGSVEPVPPEAGRTRTSCVAVRFDRFSAKLGGLPSAVVSLAWLSPQGYVDTLFLDDELRVSVGDKGGLFVLRRVQAASAPGPPTPA